ncbi:MAG: hypothetical protein JKY99_02525 [Rhizobiales bacterium]|nr:hypothetical protein [Hyphomicrobiales bacterium]
MIHKVLHILTCSVLIMVPALTLTAQADSTNNLEATILELSDGEIRVELWNETMAIVPLGDDMVLKMERHDGRIKIWQTTLEVAESSSENLPPPLHDNEINTFDDRAAEIRLLDANFDQKVDLLVETGIGYGGVNVFYDLYLQGADTLEANAAVKDLSNPEFNAGLKQILTSSRSGPHWYFSVYEMADNRPYKRLLTTNVGDGIEYSKFMLPSGTLDRELITNALADNPNNWKPITIKIPQKTTIPLFLEPDAASQNGSLQGGSVFLRRISQDRQHILVEHVPSLQTGWIDLSLLKLPDGLGLY